MNKLKPFEKKEWLRYLILGLFVLGAWLLENTLSLSWAAHNFEIYWMIGVVVAIAMMEEAMPAALFGLCGGLLMDLFSVHRFGFYSIFLFCIALFTSLLVSHFVRSTILTNCIFSGAALLLYAGCYWLFCIVLRSGDGSAAVLFTTLLPRVAVTFLLCPFLYILIRKMRKAFLPSA